MLPVFQQWLQVQHLIHKVEQEQLQLFQKLFFVHLLHFVIQSEVGQLKHLLDLGQFLLFQHLR